MTELLTSFCELHKGYYNKMVIEFRYNLESEKQDNSVSAKKEKEISKNASTSSIKNFINFQNPNVVINKIFFHCLSLGRFY